MKFWTVQSPKVLEIIEKNEVYHPEFVKSSYYKQYSELYNFMLNAFNDINKFTCKGLIYSFCISEKDMIYSIKNIDGFKYFININKDKVDCLWNVFIKNGCKILELEQDLNFNDLALPFNTFQYIMPSPVNDFLFDSKDYKANCQLILSNIKNGIIMSSGSHFDLIQSHLPYIEKSNIMNIYEIFELN